MLGIPNNFPAKPTWNYKRAPRGWDTDVNGDGGRKVRVGRMGQKWTYEGRTESHKQLFYFACELGTADEGEYGGR